MGALQPWHLFIILTIVLLVFGPGKLPELGRAVGDGLRELKRSRSSDSDTLTATVASATLHAGSTCMQCRTPVSSTARFCAACGSPSGAASVLG